MIVCIVFPDKARYLQHDIVLTRAAEKTSREGNCFNCSSNIIYVLGWPTVQNLAVIRELMFFQAVVRGSFINKISQIVEN